MHYPKEDHYCVYEHPKNDQLKVNELRTTRGYFNGAPTF